MFKLDLSQKAITKGLQHSGLLLKKHSPTILMGVGIVGVVAGTVLACKATLKVNSVIAEANKDLEKVHTGNETLDKGTYSEEDYKRDLVIVHTKKIVNIAKLYAPAALVGGLGLGCIIGSHNILTSRNTALMGAYMLIDTSFKKYRERVVSEFGKEKDLALRHGLTEETYSETETDAEGKKVKTKKKKMIAGVEIPSDYARYFDESSVQWRKDHTNNLFFLKSQQNYFNDLLKIHGHVFLNEIYDALGFPRTSAGALVGWYYDEEGLRDNFIDFGIFNVDNETRNDYINGYNKCILLDFNVDGVIYNMI